MTLNRFRQPPILLLFAKLHTVRFPVLLRSSSSGQLSSVSFYWSPAFQSEVRSERAHLSTHMTSTDNSESALVKSISMTTRIDLNVQRSTCFYLTSLYTICYGWHEVGRIDSRLKTCFTVQGPVTGAAAVASYGLTPGTKFFVHYADYYGQRNLGP